MSDVIPKDASHLDALASELLPDTTNDSPPAVTAHGATLQSRAALLAAFDQARSGRFEEFVRDVARLLDLDEGGARGLLEAMDEAASWEPGPFPLPIDLFHVEGGDAVANAITGFVRVAPGATFPAHRHLGAESVYIVQGFLRDEVTGDVSGPGTLVERSPESEHAISALPGGTDLIYLAVVHVGVQIGEVVMRPEDPEL